MSCSMTSRQTRSNLAQRLFEIDFRNAGLNTLADYELEHYVASQRDWFVVLTELNRNSLRVRYGDEFESVDGAPPANALPDIQFLKSLKYLLYQCSEASDDEYGELKAGLAELTAQIEKAYPGIKESKEYENAVWG